MILLFTHHSLLITRYCRKAVRLQTSTSRDQVRRVLLVTLILNVTVAVGKILVGTFSGAISITADGIHSLIDASANVLALAANRIAGKPADEEHPYGHRRYETIAALGIGLLLMFTAYEIITSVWERLQTGEQPEITAITFAVMIVTLIINLFVSRYERREGERLRSELLIADSANTGADVFVTLSVLVSMVLVQFGVTWADPVAAIIVVVLIGRAAWKVLRQTGGVLVDRAPYPSAELAALARGVPAVERVIRARSRGPADAAQIDIDVEVAPEMTAGQTAAIADAIRDRMIGRLTGVAEVEVHFAPQPHGSPDPALVARAAADALGLGTHEVRLSGNVLDLHVEVPPGQTLEQAHALVSQLEHDLHLRLPGLDDVVTHIEPAQMESVGALPDSDCQRLTSRALVLLEREFPLVDWHDLRILPYDGGCALTMHATVPAHTSVEDAHRTAEAAELMLRTRLSEVGRVTIHTEPPEA